MPTVTSLATVARGHSNRGANPRVVAVDIDFAAAATANGTALVATDVIQAITFEADTIILAAGITAKTVDTGANADMRVDLGTGEDADYFVDGFDWPAASAGDEARTSGIGGGYKVGADDTLDLTIAAATTVATAGTLTVWAVCVPFDEDRAKIVADEVDRDQLA